MEKALSVKWDKLKKLNEPNKLNKLFTLHAIFTSAFRILTSALGCCPHESPPRPLHPFHGLYFLTLNEKFGFRILIFMEC